MILIDNSNVAIYERLRKSIVFKGEVVLFMATDVNGVNDGEDCLTAKVRRRYDAQRLHRETWRHRVFGVKSY
jgi:hypothetical protein